MSEHPKEVYFLLEFLEANEYQAIDARLEDKSRQPWIDYCEINDLVSRDPLVRTAKGRLAQFMRGEDSDAGYRTQPSDAVPKKIDGPSLSATEYNVLLELNRQYPSRVKIVELGDFIESSRSAVGNAVKQLEKYGYVCRPNGERSGIGITESGRTAICKDS